MNCPRCRTTDLEERERDGVVLDVCRSCRGLWLDRGEMEKLIARATRDLDELALRTGDLPTRDLPTRDLRHRGEDERDRYDVDRDRYDRRRHDDDRYPYDRRRKKKWYESLADIFD